MNKQNQTCFHSVFNQHVIVPVEKKISDQVTTGNKKKPCPTPVTSFYQIDRSDQKTINSNYTKNADQVKRQDQTKKT